MRDNTKVIPPGWVLPAGGSRLVPASGAEDQREELAQHFRGGRKWWHFPVRLLKPRAPQVPTMPKRQPCPRCHGWRKRTRSVPAGAWYKCNCGHGPFFVASRDTRFLPVVMKR